LRQQFPVEYARKDGVRILPLREALIGDFRQSMLLLLGAVLLVMGAALANLVALVMVRTSERRTELSIRVAVGARRGQLIRQLMVEALLLAFIGSGLGWLFATGAMAVAVPRAPSSIPRLAEVGIDGKVLGFVSLLAIAATTLLTISTTGA